MAGFDPSTEATRTPVRRWARRSAVHFTTTRVAPGAGGSSTNRSCIWARTSSYPTSPVGGGSGCLSFPTRRTPRWPPTGCAKCSRLRPASSTSTASAPPMGANRWVICGSSTPPTAPWRAFELREGEWVLIATAQDDAPVRIRPFDAVTFQPRRSLAAESRPGRVGRGAWRPRHVHAGARLTRSRPLPQTDPGKAPDIPRHCAGYSLGWKPANRR